MWAGEQQAITVEGSTTSMTRRRPVFPQGTGAASPRRSGDGLASMLFDTYDVGDFFDELLLADGHPRPEAEVLLRKLQSYSIEELRRRQHTAERLLLQMGITFNVYGDQAGTERIFPFDIVPRVVAAAEWERIERGLKQRVHALNEFIDDIYHAQHILSDRVIPEDLIRSAQSFRPVCHDL